MKKLISSMLLAGSMMLVAVPSHAVSGTVSYFWTDGSSISIIVDGLFYYSNSLPAAVITSIDVSRRTQNGAVNFSATSSRLITGAY